MRVAASWRQGSSRCAILFALPGVSGGLSESLRGWTAARREVTDIFLAPVEGHSMHRPTVLVLCLLLAAPAAAAPAPRTPAQTPEQIADAALKEAPVWYGHYDVAEHLRDRTGDMLGQFDFRDTTHARAGS